MERLEMLRQAEQLVRETLANVSELSQAEYKEICNHYDDNIKGVRELARRLATEIVDELTS